MGILISCYDSCWGAKIANGESINPYGPAYRRRSLQEAFDRERQAQDEVCGLIVPSPYHASTSSHKTSTPLIKKPQTGLKFYSCTTYEFVKSP